MKTATESQLSVLFDGSNGLNAIKKELEKNSFPEHAIFFTIFCLLTSILEFEKNPLC